MAGACEALLASLLGRLREAGAFGALLAAPLVWLRGAMALQALLAERACGVCGCVCQLPCHAFLVRSGDNCGSLAALVLQAAPVPALASGAGLLRNLSITYPLLYCSGDLPLLRARGLPRGLAFSCPSLCCSGGLPLLRVRASIGFRPFLTFSWLLSPVLASAADLSRGLTFSCPSLSCSDGLPLPRMRGLSWSRFLS